MPAIFLTGPVRSGKSRLAVRMAQQCSDEVSYIATAERDESDPEWCERLRRHEADRPDSWTVLETAGRPAHVLLDALRSSHAAQAIIIDSLGTWLASHMPAGIAAVQVPALENALQEQAAELVDALIQAPATVIAVSEETGWGVVPAYPSGRLFRDVLGRLNQTLAQRAERAYLVVCGHALDIKAGIPVETWSL